MLEPLLLTYPGLAVLLWAIAYLADFVLTLHTARLYQAHVRQTLSFGGSFELTPAFQADVDRLNGRSRRFWLALLLSMALIVVVWVLSVVVLRLPPGSGPSGVDRLSVAVAGVHGGGSLAGNDSARTSSIFSAYGRAASVDS